MKKFILAVAVAFSMASCGSIPQETIDAAKAAIETAKTAGADVYLKDQFKGLNDSLNVIMEGITSENSNFFKSFGSFTTKLDSLKSQAEGVAAAVPAKKAEVKGQAIAAVAEIGGLISQAKELLAKAPKGKEGKAMIAQMTDQVNAVGGTVEQVSNELNSNANANYMTLLSKLLAAKQSVSSVMNEVNTAIAKVAGK